MAKETGLVFACVAPHGGEVIVELAGDQLEAFASTRHGMEELGVRMRAARPDTIVVATPHGLRIDRYIGVVTTAHTSGSLEENGARVEAAFECDRELAQAILDESRAASLPVAGVNFGALEGPASHLALDWGALIPLWFMGAREEHKPRVVLITPSRGIPREDLVGLGRSVAVAAERSGRRVAFIASADQAHTHSAEGPYGYHPAAAEYDGLIQDIVADDRLEDLPRIKDSLIESACPDSLWQMLILYGASQVVRMKGELLSYQAPTYFGMLCAAYEVSK